MNLFMIEKTFVEPLLVWTVESLKLSVALFITLFTTVILTEQQDLFIYFFFTKKMPLFLLMHSIDKPQQMWAEHIFQQMCHC